MALADVLDGYTQSAPVKALRLFERFQFVNAHPAYTYEAYDRAKAADILLDREFTALIQRPPKD
jgi:hypothetical protein